MPTQNPLPPVSAITPVAPMPRMGGAPAQQAKQPQPGQPNFQGMQPNTQTWRPSAVAALAANKGDPAAWISNLFTAQPQQQKRGCVLTNLFMRKYEKKANLPLIASLGAASVPIISSATQAKPKLKKKPLQQGDDGPANLNPVAS